jgi:hypothetical protein
MSVHLIPEHINVCFVFGCTDHNFYKTYINVCACVMHQCLFIYITHENAFLEAVNMELAQPQTSLEKVCLMIVILPLFC